MAKTILVVGIIIVLYSFVAKITGIPEIADFLPMHWGYDGPKAKYYKVVPSTEPSYSLLYTIIIGVLISMVGLVLLYLKAK